MTEAFEPYAPPRANLARPRSPEPILLTPEGVPRFGSLLRAALRVWRTGPGAVAVIVLAVHLPLNVFMKVFVGEAGDDFDSLWRHLQLQWGLTLGIGILSSLALASFVESARKGSAPSLRRCFAVAVSRWLPGIGTQILVGLFVLFGLMVLILPGIFIAMATNFTIVLVALRKTSGPAALHGSWELLRERWWPAFRLLLLLTLCEIGIALVVGGISALLPEHGLPLAGESLVTDFVTAFFFTATVILFLELEAQRKDASEAQLHKGAEP